MKDIRIKLGKRVRHLRSVRGWSQEALGEKADLHPSYIGGIERGERNVSLVNLARLAEAFQLSLAEFVTFNGDRLLKGESLKQLITEDVTADEALAAAFYSTFCRNCDNLRMLQKYKEIMTRSRGPLRSRTSPEQE
ncbi:MAG: helix-turn-helix transcriptional regulator [Nitrospira sp.]|nr:MAG: helix-turn-helix transcriptional regulator [Nitrospira sp.]